MSNPVSPELPVNALIGLGSRPIELRSPLTFENPADLAALLTLLAAQPLNANLTSISALAVATFGLSLLTKVDAAAVKAALVLVKGDVGLGNVTNDAQLKAADLDTDGTLAANSDAKIASQKAVRTYVTAAVAALVNSAPGALDTLKELADAMGDDANFAATVTTALAGKLASSAVDTDGTLAANSDLKVASQKAVKTYVDAHAGGSNIIRAHGVIHGYTDPGSPASPATLTITPGTIAAGNSQDFTITIDGVSATKTIDNSGGGSDIDSNTVCSLLATSGEWDSLNATFTPDGMGNLNVVTNDTGSGASIAYLFTTNHGGDAVPPSGNVSSAIIINGSGGLIKPIQIFFSSVNGINTGDGPWNLAFGGGAGDIIFGGTNLAPGEVTSITLNPDSVPIFINGDAGSLVLQFVGDIPSGEDVTCWIIAEQN